MNIMIFHNKNVCLHNFIVIDQQRLMMLLQLGTHKMSSERSEYFKAKVVNILLHH